MPWLQSSVTWRSTEEDGRVTITWLLPPAGQHFAAELGTSTDDFEVDPDNPTPGGDRNGSWIVGQAHTRPVVVPFASDGTEANEEVDLSRNTDIEIVAALDDEDQTIQAA